MSKTLCVILGPTGVGKTELSLRVAEALGCPIISADSRQIFKEIPIGTAAPTTDELARVKHYFIANHSIEEDYNAGQYERDCLELLEKLFEKYDTLVLTGGSMMYIDAVCDGLDDIPEVKPEIREWVKKEYEEKGLAWLQDEVQKIDPAYFEIVDRQNPQRLMHALEVSRAIGKPYSLLRTGIKHNRSFNVVKIGLSRSREVLYQRINKRVECMMESGLLDEVKAVYPYKHLNSLNTVGYKELFAYLEGDSSLSEAVDKIKQNSRHYAKRQMTWFRRDTDIHWFNLDEYETNDIICAIGNLLNSL